LVIYLNSMHPLPVSQPTTCKLPTAWGSECSGMWRCIAGWVVP